jgi:hypothetical protein
MGVAAVSYVACGGSETSDPTPKDAGADQQQSDVVANLVAPPDTGTDQLVNNDVVANLIAPPDTGSDQEADQEADHLELDVVANLVAPPDASTD